MNYGKKAVALSLATVITATPFLGLAENLKLEEGSEVEIMAELAEKDYIQFSGKILEANLEDGKGSILVEGENRNLILHISEDVKVDDMSLTKENKRVHLEKGAEIVAIYPKTTPEALSNPGQLTPELVIVKNEEALVLVDHFDKEFLSSDKKHELISEDENLKDKDLAVVFNVSTDSIPAKIKPIKTIELKGLEEVEVIEEEKSPEFKTLKGKIKELDLENMTILVETEEGDYLVDNINPDRVFDMRDSKEVKIKSLEKDAKVSVVLEANTPVRQSMPPQVSAYALIVNNSEDDMMAKIDRFDENLLSSDGELKLNSEEDYAGKVLLVRYGATTKSIPPQAIDPMITVLEDEVLEDELKVMDKVIVDGKEVPVHIYEEEGALMVEVRDLAEALGYEVKWYGLDKHIEFSKGAQWTSILLGENSYIVGKKAPFELSTAPVLKDTKTYVPLEFFGEVLLLDEVKIENGILNLK